MTKSTTKKARVIREDIKDRHTSHWDLDYLSREEFEQLMTRKPGIAEDSSTPPDDDSEEQKPDEQDPALPA